MFLVKTLFTAALYFTINSISIIAKIGPYIEQETLLVVLQIVLGKIHAQFC